MSKIDEDFYILKENIATLKSNISMRDVAERYGAGLNRKNFMHCPKHKDKTPSMQVKDNYFKCYSCGLHGDIIDFVMMMYNVEQTAAIATLASDFGIFINDKDNAVKIDYNAIKRHKADRLKKEIELKKYREEYDRKCIEFNRLNVARLTKSPKSETEVWDNEYCEALMRLPILEYYFETHSWR